MSRSIFLMAILWAAGSNVSMARDTDSSRPLAGPKVYRVVLANDKRLPSVPKNIVNRALKMAEDWISKWYHRKIRFSIDRVESVDSYIASYFQKLPVPDKWKEYPYALDGTDTVARFISQQTVALGHQSMDVLKSYVPGPIKPLITSPEEAAKNLLMLYDEKNRNWRNLRTEKGVPFFDTAFFQKQSFWYWERAFQTLYPENVTDHLIITNVMILDDALSDAPPHSLVRGGLLNGFAEEESPQAIVSTFPIFNDAPELAAQRDTDMTAKLRVQALAHIIAHEFGTHVIQGYKDVYDHTACLAVPTSGMAYGATIRRLFSGPTCAKDHAKIDRQFSLTDRYESMARRYLEVKDYAKAKDAVQRAFSLEPNRPLLKLMLRQLEAKK